MEVEVSAAEPEALEVDVLGVPVRAPADAGTFAAAFRARLAPLAEGGEVTGEAGNAVLVHLDGEFAPKRVAAAGVGEDVDADAIRTAAAAVARLAAAFGGSVG